MLRTPEAVNREGAEPMQDQPRLYVDPAQTTLQSGLELSMREDQAHYLGNVLRRGIGDGVRLFNARDGEWQAAITSLHKRGRGRFDVTTLVRPAAVETGPWLLFAPVKRDATDLVVRMATELGVRAVRPVLTDRTNNARTNTGRLRAIAIEAAEQCERLSVPAIAEPARLAAVLADWPEGHRLHAAIERLDIAEPARGGAPGDGLLIGPEGGFTPGELDVLRAHPFVTFVALGPRVLRAETAAIAGLSWLQAAREGWGAEPGGLAIDRASSH